MITLGHETLALTAPLLVWAALSDMRVMRIPNIISVILFGGFALLAIMAPPDDLAARLIAAGVVFALGFAAFAMRMIGGGDVKLLSALLLFVPAQGLLLFANLFALSLLVGIASILLLRRTSLVTASGWKSLSGSTKFPMGLSIAIAGVSYPAVVALI